MKLLYIIVLAAVLKHAEAGCYNSTDIVMCGNSSCGGSCDTGPCFCANGITDCVPTTQCVSGLNDCCPSGFYYDEEATCCTEELICNPSCAGDEYCDPLNRGTCICNTTSYEGKTIADFKPSLTCDTNVMIVSVKRCLLTYLKYDYNSMQLNDNLTSCNYFYASVDNNSKTDNVELELASGWCGNIVTNDSSKVYFTNSLHIGVLEEKLITVNPISFNFTCGYNTSMKIGLNFSLHAITETVYLPGINGIGLFPLTMAAYWDSEFTSEILDTDNVVVGKDIYLGLFLKYADGNVFVLRVEQCVASPYNDRSLATVYLVTGGCAANSGVSTTVEENGKSLEARIRMSSFQFRGQSNVYIFCDVRLCDKSDNCTKCDLARSSSDTKEVSINVPLQDEFNSYGNSGTYTALSWAVLSSTLFVFLGSNLF